MHHGLSEKRLRNRLGLVLIAAGLHLVTTPHYRRLAVPGSWAGHELGGTGYGPGWGRPGSPVP